MGYARRPGDGKKQVRPTDTRRARVPCGRRNQSQLARFNSGPAGYGPQSRVRKGTAQAGTSRASLGRSRQRPGVVCRDPVRAGDLPRAGVRPAPRLRRENAGAACRLPGAHAPTGSRIAALRSRSPPRHGRRSRPRCPWGGDSGEWRHASGPGGANDVRGPVPVGDRLPPGPPVRRLMPARRLPSRFSQAPFAPTGRVVVGQRGGRISTMSESTRPRGSTMRLRRPKRARGRDSRNARCRRVSASISKYPSG